MQRVHFSYPSTNNNARGSILREREGGNREWNPCNICSMTTLHVRLTRRTIIIRIIICEQMMINCRGHHHDRSTGTCMWWNGADDLLRLLLVDHLRRGGLGIGVRVREVR